jgi:hypothetical protein
VVSVRENVPWRYVSFEVIGAEFAVLTRNTGSCDATGNTLAGGEIGPLGASGSAHAPASRTNTRATRARCNPIGVGPALVPENSLYASM